MSTTDRKQTEKLSRELTRRFQGALVGTSKPKRKRSPSRKPIKITVTDNPLQLVFNL